MPTGKSKKSKFVIYTIKTASLLDLVRNACTTSIFPILFAVKYGDKYRIILMGERLDDSRVLYYYDSDKIAKFCVYVPVGEKESITLQNSIEESDHDYKTYKLQIMELANNPFETSFEKKPKELSNELVVFKVKDYESLVRGALSAAAESEKMGKVYYFEDGGKNYLCSFDSMEDNAITVIYAESPLQNVFNFMRYDYSTNKLESLQALEGTTHAPLAIIKLAEPFPFFKPE
ncbi:MAG: hypothetical protein QXR58_01555 [Candidatus Micrarchaeaceae archaeon]